MFHMDAQTIFLLAVAGGLLLICALITAGLLIKRTISVTVAGFSFGALSELDPWPKSIF